MRTAYYAERRAYAGAGTEAQRRLDIINREIGLAHSLMTPLMNQPRRSFG
jgi:hypothetical protein